MLGSFPDAGEIGSPDADCNEVVETSVAAFPPLARMEYESGAEGDRVESAESTLEISGVSSFGRERASATTFALP